MTQPTAIEEYIPVVEEILGNWKNTIGSDYAGYKNHVYRLINFCFVQHRLSEEERAKIIIAACFHDLGLWSHGTFDYLRPSVSMAKQYLSQNNLESWSSEVALMIDMHHKLMKYEQPESRLIEVFRRGDLVDFSWGIVKCGIPNAFIQFIRARLPNAGFHCAVMRHAGRWFLQHPLNPLPVLKW